MASEFVVPMQSQIRYLQRRLAEIELLNSHLAKGDFKSTETLGHQIKGNARTFDFLDLEEMGVRLENAAKEKNPEKVKTILAEMKEVILKLLGSLI
jgi:HPt (histidine-containing phosphotransfer) domain-containing protein